MMAISKALDEVKMQIPPQILQAVFVQRDQRWRQAPASIDEQILSLVIRPRVLVDCDLVGGTEILISLEGCLVDRPNDYTNVYRVPKDRTQGRSIIAIKHISYTDPTRTAAAGVPSQLTGGAMLNAGMAVMDAHSPIPITSTAHAQLIGENVLMVKDVTVMPSNIFLRAVIGYDENMSHLQLRSYRAFSQLVVLACKSYIYNQMVIRIDQGELQGGMQLGRFKEIVDNYADSEELYQVYITEKWQKIAMMNDTESFTRHLRLIIGGSR